jgi:hypothetical protein
MLPLGWRRAQAVGHGAAELSLGSHGCGKHKEEKRYEAEGVELSLLLEQGRGGAHAASARGHTAAKRCGRSAMTLDVSNSVKNN